MNVLRGDKPFVEEGNRRATAANNFYQAFSQACLAAHSSKII